MFGLGIDVESLYPGHSGGFASDERSDAETSRWLCRHLQPQTRPRWGRISKPYKSIPCDEDR